MLTLLLRRARRATLWLGFAACAATLAAAPADAPARLLRTPTVSATHIAFAYANNIWVVERAGGAARRLTSFQGQTSNPRFSPDGRRRSRSAPSTPATPMCMSCRSLGGEPTRLTWHPGADVVQGWTPDGKSVLFASARATWAPTGAPRFWTVPVAGGVEEPLPLPRAYQGKISPDGTRVAYRMNTSWDEERRNYRGGQNRPDLDRRSQDVRSGRRRRGPIRRTWIRCGSATPSTSSPIATACRTCGRTTRRRRSSRRSRRSPTST